MTHGELSNFTHEELSHLRYIDLSLQKIDILQKNQHGELPLPDYMKEKLRYLCGIMPKDSLPKKLELNTVKDGVALFNALWIAFKNVCEIDERFHVIETLRNIAELFRAMFD